MPSTCCLGQNTQGWSIPSVHPGAQGHGGLHPGGSQARIHPTIHLTSDLELLLRGQEGWGLEAVYRLLHAELPDGEAALATSLGHSHPRETLRSPHLLQVGPAECLQPH